MSKSRDIRRHHHERMEKKTSKFWWLAPKFYHGTEEERQLHIKKMAETRKPCSCHMCGNPRRMGWGSSYGGLTMQERRALEDDDEC